MSSSLHTLKFAIIATGSISSTKLSTVSSNHLYYGRMISKTLSSKSASNSLLQMNQYSSMTRKTCTSSSQSTSTISLHSRNLTMRCNSFSTLSLANSNSTILALLRSFSVLTSIDRHPLVPSTCLSLHTHKNCSTNSTWQDAILSKVHANLLLIFTSA